MFLGTKKEWNQVDEIIKRDDEGKIDYIRPISDIRMNDLGQIINNRYQASRGFTPDEHALGQLSSRLGINVGYARKCNEDSTSLLAYNVNHWLERNTKDVENDTHWMLRTKRDSLRGVLSDKYSQLDNRYVFDTLGKALEGGSIVDVRNLDITSKHLNFRMIFPDLASNVGTLQTPDKVFVGIHVTNSEVGASKVRIDSCLYREVCTNGLIARVGGKSLLEQRHIHLSKFEMENKVEHAIMQAMEHADGLVERFAKAREVKVQRPIDLIKKLAEKEKYSQAFTDTIINSFNSEPESSAFGVINALTHASQTLPFERRLDVEVSAGSLLEQLDKPKRWTVE